MQAFQTWLAGEAGRWFLEEEQRCLAKAQFPRGLQRCFIGLPAQAALFPYELSTITDFEAGAGLRPQGQILGLLPESQDLVVLPHTLEMVADPFVLLKKALTLVKPSGYLVILGFNSSGLWQLAKPLARDLPSFFPQPEGQVQAYLYTEQFELAEKRYGIYRWPLGLWHKNQPGRGEQLLEKCLPFLGAIYILVMQKLKPAYHCASPAWRQLARPETKIKVMTRNS